MGLRDRILTHTKVGESLKVELIAKLEMIKDNPAIRRIDKRCFVIMSSDLDRGILSAEHYDNQWQVGQIVSTLEKQDIGAILNTLDRVILTNKHRVSSTLVVEIGSQVVEHIKSIL